MKKVKLSFKKITTPRLIYIQIIYNCFIKWIIGELGAPSALNYVSDVITVILFIQILFHRMNGYKPDKKIAPTKIAIIFFIYTIVNWIAHLYSPIHYLWGLRNVFRFYVFFAACTTFLSKEDVKKIFDLMFVIFIVNLVMSAYQFFVLDKKADHIAGFFGTTEVSGGNGGWLVFASLICIITIVQYMHARSSLIKVIIAIVGTLFVAVIAEIKVLFALLAASVALSSLFTRFSLKKLVIIVGILIVMPFAIDYLYELFPKFDNFFEWETIYDYAAGEGGYTGHGDVNRFTAIQYCFDNFLETAGEKFFGFGLGAADGSTNFELVTSEFYIENYHTHYTWFVVPFILIENGIIGLCLYWLVFLNVFKDATLLRRHSGPKGTYYIIAQIVSIFMVFFSFNNASIRSEVVGYLCYALLAIPYIMRKRD